MKRPGQTCASVTGPFVSPLSETLRLSGGDQLATLVGKHLHDRWGREAPDEIQPARLLAVSRDGHLRDERASGRRTPEDPDIATALTTHSAFS